MSGPMIELGGRQFQVNYNLPALAAAQEVLKVDRVTQVLSRIDDLARASGADGENWGQMLDVDAHDVAGLLWAGVRRDWQRQTGQEPTLEEVAELVTLHDMEKVLLGITQAVTVSARPRAGAALAAA